MSCGHAKSCINMFKLNSFVMLPIDQTSFKEKNVSLIRAATLGAGWVSVIAMLLVYRKDRRSEKKLRSLKRGACGRAC